MSGMRKIGGKSANKIKNIQEEELDFDKDLEDIINEEEREFSNEDSKTNNIIQHPKNEIKNILEISKMNEILFNPKEFNAATLAELETPDFVIEEDMNMLNSAGI